MQSRVIASALAFVTLVGWNQGYAQLPVVHSFNGTSLGDEFGDSVSSAGDVNGDGFADIIVGSPGDDNNGQDSGSVTVFSGLDGSVLYAIDGDSAGDRFGTAVSGAGDVDGDTFADFIVGAPFDDNNGANSGSAKVFSGLNGSLFYTLLGDSAGDAFGASVSSAGNVNGDSFDDVIVGAPGDDNNGSESGSARVFSGLVGAPLYTLSGDGPGDRFGNSVSGAGRVDADLMDDVIVGAPEKILSSLSASASPGYARVFSGINGAVIHTPSGAIGSVSGFGWSVGGAGDVNGDGRQDLVIGAPFHSASVQVVSGLDGSVLRTFLTFYDVDWFGFSVDGAGDVDGDGVLDVVAGAPLAGLVWVYSGSGSGVIVSYTGDNPGEVFGTSVSNGGDVTGDGLGKIVVGAPAPPNNPFVSILPPPSAGYSRVLSFCGARPYGTSQGGQNTLDLRWVPSAGTLGSVTVSGAVQGSAGLLGVSTSDAQVVLGGLTLLIDLSPGSSILIPFSYSPGGQTPFPGTLSSPALAGTSLFTQGAENQAGTLFLSNGLELRFCP